MQEGRKGRELFCFAYAPWRHYLYLIVARLNLARAYPDAVRLGYHRYVCHLISLAQSGYESLVRPDHGTAGDV